MARRILPFAAICLLMSGVAHASADFNIVIGQKMLDENDWGLFDEQSAVTGQLTFGDDDWPVYMAIDVMVTDDNVGVPVGFTEGATQEIAVGARKIWDKGTVRPYVGGGIVRIEGEFSRDAFSIEDDTIGLWVGGGVFWRLGDSFNIGVDLRVSRGSIDLPGGSVEAGGEHLGVLVGFGW